MTTNCVRYEAGLRRVLAEDAVFETGILGFNIVTPFVELNEGGRLLMRARYATDGITGITGTPWAWLLERKWLIFAAFGHDGLYQLIRLGLLPVKYRAVADDLLRRWSLEAGAWQWQADMAHGITNKHGVTAIFPSAQVQILVAP